ncbi:LapA family protein [Piscinibacter sakaiensis]|uniref:LapA family protein n=1 Tax=Piscinibacter sakaiensis TaxID=1547922 RepID=UPI003AAC9B6B
MVRTLLFILALLLTALFVAMNWPTFLVPTALTLGFVDIHAPLGIIMLGILGVALLGFVAWALSMQGRALMESRRMAKELHAKSELADKAEASRFTDLRAHLDTRLDQLQRSVEQQGNGLAAHFGQLEDRMHASERPAVPVAIEPAPPPPPLR